MNPFREVVFVKPHGFSHFPRKALSSRNFHGDNRCDFTFFGDTIDKNSKYERQNRCRDQAPNDHVKSRRVTVSFHSAPSDFKRVLARAHHKERHDGRKKVSEIQSLIVQITFRRKELRTEDRKHNHEDCPYQ